MHEGSGADELAAALLTSIRLLVSDARKARPHGGLTQSEMAALIDIRRAAETTSGALARKAGVSAQAMGATIAALEARGLIEREKDADDGRRILLRLTDAGSEVIDARRDARVNAIVRVLTEDFSAADRATLSAAAPLLQRLAESL
ncbi:MarR family winged helix-turn-helix transcriptional regulator [Gryllotalpicola reticulitermitis]|uniref:MarR family winged helix-turn-helix transcriptional regulator n=1 Tax=Gryllotalpicola reticulitermitis TaxID=1184153 RepID=A0ABV8Q1R3_9MICO